MCYSLFGRGFPPRSRNSCFPQPFCQPGNHMRQCNPRQISNCPQPFTGKFCNSCTERCKDNTFIKSTVFGGLVIPKGTDKGATFHVASLNLNTSGCNNYVVQLVYSSNIIADKSKMRLRFQIDKQTQGHEFSNPVSAGMLYNRETEGTEANSFTLSVYDCNSIKSTCCSYNVQVNIEAFETAGNVIIANPTLIATIIKYE